MVMSEATVQSIVAADGRVIAARFFEPQGPAHGAVLIVPAMGVSQGYYRGFAEWLARQGFFAVTFDYRGVGLSRTEPLRELRADIFDWARLDCGAMVDAVTKLAGTGSLFWVGHSLGGQILPFVSGVERFKRVVTIATGSGYWRENSSPLNYWAWWLWYVAAPLSMQIFGYFPGKRLRKVGDLPRGVMEQWRRWCVNRDYAAGAEAAHAQYAAVTTPITSLSFTDDEFMSSRNTESIHAFYTSAPKAMKRISPAEIGAKRIGHFGFFRPTFEKSLWDGYLLPELK